MTNNNIEGTLPVVCGNNILNVPINLLDNGEFRQLLYLYSRCIHLVEMSKLDKQAIQEIHDLIFSDKLSVIDKDVNKFKYDVIYSNYTYNLTKLQEEKDKLKSLYESVVQTEEKEFIRQYMNTEGVL